MTLETILRNLRYRTKGRLRFLGAAREPSSILRGEYHRLTTSWSRTKITKVDVLASPIDLSTALRLTSWTSALHAGWPSLSYNLYDMRRTSHGLQLLLDGWGERTKGYVASLLLLLVDRTRSG